MKLPFFNLLIKFTKSTLGGCIIEESGSFILVSKEPKLKKMSYQPEK